MDVIALHGAGFTGAVAPLGTALTEGQLGEMWKLADEPYLCFDGDNAGRRAAQRAAERALPLLRPGKSLRFLALPAGEDPDSLIRARGADAIRRVLELARPLADVLWDMETEGKPADTPERRASIQSALSSKGRPRSPIRLGPRLLPERDARAAGQGASPAAPGRWRPRRAAAVRSAATGPEPRPLRRRHGRPAGRHRSRQLAPGAGPAGRPDRAAGPAPCRGRRSARRSRSPIPSLRRLESALLEFFRRGPLGVDPAAEEALGRREPLEERLLDGASAAARPGAGRRDGPRQGPGIVPRDRRTEAWLDRWRRTARHLQTAGGRWPICREAEAGPRRRQDRGESAATCEAALRHHQGSRGLGNRIAGLRIFLPANPIAA